MFGAQLLLLSLPPPPLSLPPSLPPSLSFPPSLPLSQQGDSVPFFMRNLAIVGQMVREMCQYSHCMHVYVHSPSPISTSEVHCLVTLCVHVDISCGFVHDIGLYTVCVYVNSYFKAKST